MELERKNVLLQISNDRLKDATVLLKNIRYNGAVYLGGYVIECLLKTAICARLRRDTLPAEYRTHDLDSLMRSSGLFPAMVANASLYPQYVRIKVWSVALRYQGKRYDADAAKKFLAAVKKVKRWILEKMQF
jgi:HEPN domain-containing protein